MHPTPDADLPGHVQQALRHFLDDRIAELTEIDADVTAAAEQLAAFVLGGGKRIRPTFAWWGWRGAGGDPAGPEAGGVLRAISALELLQACALIHDDLIDDSLLRRGSPTLHIQFGRLHADSGWLGGAENFGLAGAVLFGDLAMAWSDDMLHTCGLPPAALTRAARAWRAMRTEVLAGQYIDVLTQARGDESPAAALRINRFKTASYTVRRPLQLGGLLADAEPDVLAAYDRFGADIGMAFQLRDDLLGVFGDPKITGKPAGDDLREGKRTLLMALGLELADDAGARQAADAIRGALGNKNLAESDVDRVRELLVRLGAVDAVESRIDQLTESALTALSTAPIAGDAAAQLADLAITATKRNH